VRLRWRLHAISVEIVCGLVLNPGDFGLTGGSDTGVGSPVSLSPRILSCLDEATATVRKIQKVFEHRVVGELYLALIALSLFVLLT